MKSNYFINFILLIIVFGFINSALAQSDKEIVDKFKAEYAAIEKSIKDATTSQELTLVLDKITILKQDYVQHKELLDKSLYPDKYDESIEKLNKAYLLRQGDFSTIDVLQTEVGELKQQVEFLNRRNNELLVQVQKLEAQREKDAKTIKKLENLVVELRSSIRERDELVLSMIDSLMPPTMRDKEGLTIEDKNMVATEEQKDNVLNNVKTTIRDNIRFVKATSLKPDDLESIREQQKDFVNKWQKVGIKLVEVYAEDGNKSEELKQIDGLFSEWAAVVKQEAWVSISDEFSLNGIELMSFKNGEEFTNSVLLFVDDELKNLGVKSDEESKRIYAQFADSTWFATIQPVWMNYLIENKMLTDENKNKMESKIAEWKNALYPSNWWIYLILAVVVIAGAALFFIKRKKPASNVSD
ncbi:MAG: cell division protein ZapB [Ignavibacteriaceae bacterium]|nr:cell division protein ZapB [Ignavibacteriaceae bacterium]